MLSSLALAALTGLAAIQPAEAAYSLARNYSGSSFFDRWNFYGNYDNLTEGDTLFANASYASSAQLAYINDAGNAIIKVDNTSVVPYNEKRYSVRIASTDLYGAGSLFVFDALHTPYGCSVWPAMWATTPNWPYGGEIDIFEGVNLQTTNQMALHTTTGCYNNASTSQFTGNETYSNCDSNVDSNNGCTVLDPSTASYGAGLAAAGGGVWATAFNLDGISTWFFTRDSVPSDLLTSNASAVPDPSGWGLPVAYWPSSGCDISTHFSAQQLVIDITMCGQWAGVASVFNETCSGTCYEDYVLVASTYDTAYFEIPSLRVYQDASLNSTSSSSSSSSSSSTTTSASGAKTTSSASRFGASALVGALVAVGAFALLA